MARRAGLDQLFLTFFAASAVFVPSAFVAGAFSILSPGLLSDMAMDKMNTNELKSFGFALHAHQHLHFWSTEIICTNDGRKIH